MQILYSNTTKRLISIVSLLLIFLTLTSCVSEDNKEFTHEKDDKVVSEDVIIKDNLGQEDEAEATDYLLLVNSTRNT